MSSANFDIPRNQLRNCKPSGVQCSKILIGGDIPLEEKSVGRFPAHESYASDSD
jgi:hypothetical protein